MTIAVARSSLRSVHGALLAALLVCATASGTLRAQHAQSADTGARAAAAATTPEAFAQRYIATLTSGDYAANAKLMHPAALASIRRFVTVLGEKDPSGSALKQLLDVPDTSAVRTLTDEQLYERFLRRTMGAQAELAAAMRSAKVDVLGHVDEGTDMTHVLYRLRLEIDGVEMRKVDVLTLKRDRGEWRAMLSADIDNLVARLAGARAT
ncbi:MAG TPA: hypothetical protein VFS44_08590 [Gemmatimonadaceae bacterium]|nr:hypothetical protein [Gemmatimonadaceae bacterium]